MPNTQDYTSESSLASRVALRFAAPYFLLYSLYTTTQPVYVVTQWWMAIWDSLVPWVGSAVLGIDRPISLVFNGSGDTTADYVRLFMFFMLALVACGVWTVLEREREHPRLAAWLVVWARYWLATWMISYGLGKLLPPTQFAEPDLVRLTQTYGDSSPMGLAWTFMGHSQGYTAFTGLAELLGGALLLSRRTTTLGALVCIAVMANVVVMNFSYDIPVKLFSSHLLAVAIVIAALDRRRLMALFLRGDAVAARSVAPVMPDSERLRKVYKAGYIVALVAMVVSMQSQRYGELVDRGPPAIHGVFEVVDDQVTCDPQIDCDPVDARPMRRVVFGLDDDAAIDFVTGPKLVLRAEVIDEMGLLTLQSNERELPMWSFERLDDDTLVLEGRLGGARHKVRLRPSTETFLLRERGFHWINEAPFNR